MEGHEAASWGGEARLPREVRDSCSGELGTLPDRQRRIAQEHEAVKRAASGEDDDRSKKRRRLPRGVQGVHAADMSLVTPENAANRPGWHVTALGRVIRPIRMRPDHPLPDPQESATAAAKSNAGGKKRKRVREPPTRARKRKIDPTHWGSVHLKGAFLENVIVADIPKSTPPTVAQPNYPEEDEDSTSGSDESSSEGTSDAEELVLHEKATVSGPTPSRSPTSQLVADTPHTLLQTAPRVDKNDDAQTDLRQETQKSLNLLQALFGGKGDEDWGDKESVGSDIEIDTSTVQGPQATTAVEGERVEVADNDDEVSVESASPKPKQVNVPVQTTKLKDLFAPREEDGMSKTRLPLRRC